MPSSFAVQQSMSFGGRLVTAFVELTLAAAVIAGSVFVGHELREWREWYWALPPTFESPPGAPAVTEP